MWLFNRKNVKKIAYKPEKTITIGLMATSSCVGVTHFAWMLYSYLKGFHQKKVFFVSFDEESLRFGKRTKDRELQKDLYFGLNAAEILTLKEREADYILFDYGCDRSTFRDDFLRNDIRILFGSLCAWKVDAFREYLDMESRMVLRSMHVFYRFGEECLAKKLAKGFGIEIKRVADCADPFLLRKEQILELIKLDPMLQI